MWKRYKERYLVNEFGYTYNIKRSQFSKHSKQTHGYVQVCIYGKLEYVHRIVGELFLSEKPSNLHEINHKDGDKSNNHFSNLEWATKSQNIKHSFDKGLNFTPRERLVQMGKISSRKKLKAA